MFNYEQLLPDNCDERDFRLWAHRAARFLVRDDFRKLMVAALSNPYDRKPMISEIRRVEAIMADVDQLTGAPVSAEIGSGWDFFKTHKTG